MAEVNNNLDLDLIQWLGDDMSIKVFSYLDDPRDLICASAVSSSWEKFVIENGLCKQLCLKIIPEVSAVVHSIEVDNVIEPDSDMLERQYANLECLKRNHKVYSRLAFGLTPLKNNCISHYMVACITMDPMKEGVANTFEATYKPKNDPKTLLYRLCSKICLVTEINMLPFLAKDVRFRFGYHIQDKKIESKTAVPDSLTFNGEFKWTYTSPVYPLSRENMKFGDIILENKLQKFKLPEPVLCIGGFLLVELLGRVKKENGNNLFYQRCHCITQVKVVGRPISPAFFVRMHSLGRCSLKYLPNQHKAQDSGCWSLGLLD